MCKFFQKPIGTKQFNSNNKIFNLKPKTCRWDITGTHTEMKKVFALLVLGILFCGCEKKQCKVYVTSKEYHSWFQSFRIDKKTSKTSEKNIFYIEYADYIPSVIFYVPFGQYEISAQKEILNNNTVSTYSAEFDCNDITARRNEIDIEL